MNHDNNQDGFTIIELMLSMTFVAVLLLGIALTIIQVGNIYNKGMALRQINQSARDISDDLTRTVAGSNLTLSQDYKKAEDVAAGPGGRLCLGNYSYVWNYAKAFQNEEKTKVTDPSIIRYTSAAKKSTKINLLKIADQAKQYCQKGSTGLYTYQTVQVSDEATAKELLTNGEHSIGIQNLSIALIASDDTTTEKVYAFNFTLGTGDVSAMTPDQSACLPPNNLSSDITYCNVRGFDLVLRAGNRVN